VVLSTERNGVSMNCEVCGRTLDIAQIDKFYRMFCVNDNCPEYRAILLRERIGSELDKHKGGGCKMPDETRGAPRELLEKNFDKPATDKQRAYIRFAVKSGRLEPLPKDSWINLTRKQASDIIGALKERELQSGK